MIKRRDGKGAEKEKQLLLRATTTTTKYIRNQ